MFVVDCIEFKPLEKHPDLIINMRPLSHYEMVTIGQKNNKNLKESEENSDNNEIIFEAIRTCVMKVSGMKVGGVDVTNGDLFVKYAPREVFVPVMEKVTEICGLSSEQEKKS